MRLNFSVLLAVTLGVASSLYITYPMVSGSIKKKRDAESKVEVKGTL